MKSISMPGACTPSEEVVTDTGFGFGCCLRRINNPWTIMAYPEESIDAATFRASCTLDPAGREALDPSSRTGPIGSFR